VLVGPGHERLGCALRVRRGGEDGSHLLRIHLIAQAVAAEHEAVAGAHLELPEVDVHVGPDAEGAGQDVTVRVDRGLGRGHLALADLLLGEAVIVRDLDHACA